jgi:segregation and condensation protein B
MEPKKLIEAVLFISSRPVSVTELSGISGLKAENVHKVVNSLREEYKKRESAIEIKKIDDRYVMQVKEIFASHLSGLVEPILSQDVLKTLSYIALRQPITQAEVFKARGYLTYSHVKELKEKGFISTERMGRTKLLTTTDKFSDYFGFPRKIEGIKKELAKKLKYG